MWDLTKPDETPQSRQMGIELPNGNAGCDEQEM